MSAIYIPDLTIPERGSKFICIREDGTVCDLHGNPLGMTAVPVGDLADAEAYRAEFMAGVYSIMEADPDNFRANAIIDLYDVLQPIIRVDRMRRNDSGNEPAEEDRRHIGDAITAARAYVAVSIKHSAYRWKFGMPLVLWGDRRTADDEARRFGGYTIFPSCAEHYALGDFKKKGYPADIVKPEPVTMEIGFCKKWEKYDTVLVEAGIYEAYCKICNLPLEPPS